MSEDKQTNGWTGVTKMLCAHTVFVQNENQFKNLIFIWHTLGSAGTQLGLFH